MNSNQIIAEIKERLENLDIPPTMIDEAMQENDDTHLIALETVSQEDIDAYYDKVFSTPSWINHGTVDKNAFWSWSDSFVYFLRQYLPRYSDERDTELYYIPIRPGTNDPPEIVGLDD